MRGWVPALLVATGPAFGAPPSDVPVKACTASNLDVRFIEQGNGNAEALLVLRNIGEQPCYAAALPSLAFEGGDGEPRLVGIRHPVHPSVARVTIAPGEVASAPLAWKGRDIDHTHNCIVPLMAAVNLPGGALRLLFGRQMCASGGSLVELTQWPLTSWHAQGTSGMP